MSHFLDLNGHGFKMDIFLFIYLWIFLSFFHYAYHKTSVESSIWPRGVVASQINFILLFLLRRFIKHRTIAQRHGDVIQTINPSELLFNKERNVDALSSFMVGGRDENINGTGLFTNRCVPNIINYIKKFHWLALKSEREMKKTTEEWQLSRQSVVCAPCDGLERFIW